MCLTNNGSSKKVKPDIDILLKIISLKASPNHVEMRESIEVKESEVISVEACRMLKSIRGIIRI